MATTETDEQKKERMKQTRMEMWASTYADRGANRQPFNPTTGELGINSKGRYFGVSQKEIPGRRYYQLADGTTSWRNDTTNNNANETMFKKAPAVNAVVPAPAVNAVVPAPAANLPSPAANAIVSAPAANLPAPAVNAVVSAEPAANAVVSAEPAANAVVPTPAAAPAAPAESFNTNTVGSGRFGKNKNKWEPTTKSFRVEVEYDSATNSWVPVKTTEMAAPAAPAPAPAAQAGNNNLRRRKRMTRRSRKERRRSSRKYRR